MGRKVRLILIGLAVVGVLSVGFGWAWYGSCILEANQCVQRGSSWQEQGAWPEALAEYSEAIRLNPYRAVAYHQRGKVWHITGKPRKAIADYSDALRLDAESVATLTDRAEAWNGVGEPSHALADCGRAISLDPTNATAYCVRGYAREKLGQLDEALADYEQAIRLDSKSVLAYARRAWLWRKAGDFERLRNDFFPRSYSFFPQRFDRHKALADLSHALRIDPSDGAAYAARALLWLNEPAQAIADHTEVIRLNPRDVLAYEYRARWYLIKGDLAAAIEDLSAAIGLDPSSDLFHALRGEAWAQQGVYRESITDYEDAVRCNPYAPRYHDQLAWLYATCPRSECRDGQKAVEHGLMAYCLTDQGADENESIEEPYWVLRTIAAGYAEAGEYERAVQLMKRVIELHTVQDSDEYHTERHKRMLESFKAKQPWRDNPTR